MAAYAKVAAMCNKNLYRHIINVGPCSDELLCLLDGLYDIVYPSSIPYAPTVLLHSMDDPRTLNRTLVNDIVNSRSSDDIISAPVHSHPLSMVEEQPEIPTSPSVSAVESKKRKLDERHK
ncbi:hypothetical protein IW150_000049 [Coemansia sp. RSA 2607]|nr:hypothetical protein IW150_000049 [Coemansia sp. RSA 2607]KAJ2398494.1 hypothetical protein GGI05_000050 [Coemansia sp. RSA 2603]